MTGGTVPDQPGKVWVQIDATPRVLAQQLFVESLCASTLVEHLRWFVGWDIEEIDRAVTMMDATWCRTARSKAGCSPTSAAAGSPRGGYSAGPPRHGIATALVKRPRPPRRQGPGLRGEGGAARPHAQALHMGT